MLVLTVKCEWDFVGIRASWTRNAVALIDQHIRGKCNNKFYAKGKINLDGEEKTFNRCLIMIQPRYLLTNYFEDRPTLSTPPTAAEQQALADYRTARNAHNTKVPQARAKCGGPHFKVSVNYHNPVPAPPAPLPPKPPPSWSGNTLTY